MQWHWQFLGLPDAAKGMNSAHLIDFFTPKNREQQLSTRCARTDCVGSNTYLPYSTAAVFVNPMTACLLVT
jgi:hypothetical protein